jgi:hypothetical protein
LGTYFFQSSHLFQQATYRKKSFFFLDNNNPTLMRLRELDVLEKVAGNSKLNVVLDERGLADRVVNLL